MSRLSSQIRRIEASTRRQALESELLRIARRAVDEGVGTPVIYERLRERIRTSGIRSRIRLGPIVDDARQLPLFGDEESS
jgi:hypothetical protein